MGTQSTVLGLMRRTHCCGACRVAGQVNHHAVHGVVRHIVHFCVNFICVIARSVRMKVIVFITSFCEVKESSFKTPNVISNPSPHPKCVLSKKYSIVIVFGKILIIRQKLHLEKKPNN